MLTTVFKAFKAGEEFSFEKKMEFVTKFSLIHFILFL